MDIKQELFMISPSPIQVGDREIFSLSLSQVLGYLVRVDNKTELVSFLGREHGIVTNELIQIYEASLSFLSIEEEQPKKGDDLPEGYSAKGPEGLAITSYIYAVGKQFNMGFIEVLNMPITQYYLCLKYCRELIQAEKQAYNNSKRSKK